MSTAAGDIITWFIDQGKNIFKGISDNLTFEWCFQKGSEIGLGFITLGLSGLFEKWGKEIGLGFTNAITLDPLLFSKWGKEIQSGLTTLTNIDTFTKWGTEIWNGFISVITAVTDTFKKWGKDIGLGMKAEFKWPALPTFKWPEIKFKWPELPTLKVEMPGEGGGGGGYDVAGHLGIKKAKGGDISSYAGSKNLAPLWSAMGAMRAADGIRNVPGVGISDTVPILARAGERVLTPQQARSQDMGGNITLNIEIKVESGGVGPGKAEIREMGEKIIEYIRRESKNGRNVLRPSGVY